MKITERAINLDVCAKGTRKDSIFDVCREYDAEDERDVILVEDENKKIEGYIPAKNTLKAIADNNNCKLEELMHTDQHIVDEDTPIEEAMKIMTENQTDYLFIQDKDKLKSIISKVKLNYKYTPGE